MKEWQQQLIFIRQKQVLIMLNFKYLLPEGLIYVNCQAKACVLHKRHNKINDPYT